MTKQQIIIKTKGLFIKDDPRLADPDYRKQMSNWDKAQLVREMLDAARKIETFNS